MENLFFDVSLASCTLSAACATHARPGATRARPGATCARPDAAHARPDTARPRPGTARPRPGTARARPDTARARPDTARARPDTARARPGTARARPDTARARPDTARPGRRPQALRRPSGNGVFHQVRRHDPRGVAAEIGLFFRRQRGEQGIRLHPGKHLRHGNQQLREVAIRIGHRVASGFVGHRQPIRAGYRQTPAASWRRRLPAACPAPWCRRRGLPAGGWLAP